VSHMIDNLYLNVGAMKAGTTWLYAHLQDHPDIHFSREKEVHYFSHVNTYRNPLSDPARLSLFQSATANLSAEASSFSNSLSTIDWYRHYAAGPIDDSWYRDLFSGRRSERYCADFSNLNSHLGQEGWSHAKSICRNLRVTLILRNPLERLWSHVKFHTKVVGQYDEMLNWTEEEFSTNVQKAFIWDNTEYSRMVKALRDNLEVGQFKIMFFEDIHSSPLQALRDVEGFLQITRSHHYDQSALDQRVNHTKPLDFPEYFEGLFKDKLAKEVEGLIELGLTPPSSWTG